MRLAVLLMWPEALPSLTASWKDLVVLRTRLAAVHADADAPPAIAAGEPTLRIELRILLGDFDLQASVWVPNGVLTAALRGLDPVTPVPQANAWPDATATTALDVDVIRSVPVDVAVTFPSVGMTPAAILALDVGDVIRLHPTDQPLELSAGSIRIGWVRPAQHAGRTACQVLALESSRPRPASRRG